MGANNKTARIAGFIYLLVVICGLFDIMYVPSKIIIWNDPAATVKNLAASEWLFRSAIAVNIINHILFILLPLVLYKLFKSVKEEYAFLMVLLALISIPVSYNLIIKELDIINLIDASKIPPNIQPEILQSQVMSLFNSYYNGFLICQIFWGLWLLPLGVLVIKSGFLPKLIGIFLILGCLGYLFDSFGRIFSANYYDYFNSGLVLLPASFGEIGLCLWLLIAGIKVPQTKTI